MRNFLIIFLNNIILLEIILAGHDKFTVIVNKIECVDKHPELCIDQECSIKPVSRYKTLLNLGCTLPRKFKSLRIKYQLNFKYTVYRPYLIDFDEDICKVMDSRVGAIAFNSIKGSINNYTNIFHPCPYEGRLYVKDFPITNDVAHQSMPIGEYRSDIRFYTKSNQTLIFAKIFVNFKPHGAKYDSNG